MDSRGKKQKNFKFSEKKACAINSLHQVNCFLSHFSKACILKKIIK